MVVWGRFLRYLFECLNGRIQRLGQTLRFGGVRRVIAVNTLRIGQIRLCIRKDIEDILCILALDCDGISCCAVCHGYSAVRNLIVLSAVCDTAGRITCDDCRGIPFDNGARTGIRRHFAGGDLCARNGRALGPFRIGNGIGASGNLIGRTAIVDGGGGAVYSDPVICNGARFDTICAGSIFRDSRCNTACRNGACTGIDGAAAIGDRISHLAIRHLIGDVIDCYGAGSTCSSVRGNGGCISSIRRTCRLGDSLGLGVGDTVIACMGDGIPADVGGIRIILVCDGLCRRVRSPSVLIDDTLLIRLDGVAVARRLVGDDRCTVRRAPLRILCAHCAIAVGEDCPVGQCRCRLVAVRRIADGDVVDGL